MTDNRMITWLEPVKYKWATTSHISPLWQVLGFVVVFVSLMGLFSKFGASIPFGPKYAAFIAMVVGFVAAYLLPFLVRFGNRTCLLDDSGIRCDELVGAKWRHSHWEWGAIEYCVIKPIQLKGTPYHVLHIFTYDDQEFNMALSKEVDVQAVGSAILRAGCRLQNA